MAPTSRISVRRTDGASSAQVVEADPTRATTPAPVEHAATPSRATRPAPAGASTTGDRNAGVRAAAAWSIRVLAVIAAVLATLAGAAPILDAVYSVWPALEPEGPPAALGVTLDEVVLEERWVPCAGGAVCNVVSFELELVGYTGARSVLEWAAFDATTRRRVALAGTDTANQDGGVVETEAANDRLNGSLFLPIPREAGCIVVRLYVYDEEDDASRTRLDYADTPPFHTHSATAACPAEAAAGAATIRR